MLDQDNVCGMPVKIKPYVPSAISALIAAGLQVSGVISWPLAFLFWGLAAILAVWAGACSLIDRGWRFQWPLIRMNKTGHVNKSIGRNTCIGDIYVDFNRLKEDRLSEITIRVFNGTDYTIAMSDVKGGISYYAIGGFPSVEPKLLPSPTLGTLLPNRMAHPGCEWIVVLNQHVPAVMADQICELLEDKRNSL
jgi:hypothetical protein